MVVYAVKNRLTGLASEMAFNGMLGLFPAILAIVTAIGLFENSLKSTLVNLAIRFTGIFPPQVWQLLLDFIDKVKLPEEKSWFSFIFLIAIWVFSGVLSAAMNALDHIYQVPQSLKRSFWQHKFVAILLTIGTFFLLTIASFLLIVGDFLLRFALQQNWASLLLITWKIFTIIFILTIISTAVYLINQVRQINFKLNKKNNKYLLTIFIFVSGIFSTQLVYYLFLFVSSLIINSNIEKTFLTLLISIWRLLSFPLALVIIAVAFAFIYRFGTSHWNKGTPIIPGAILASVSWVVVSGLFRFYVAWVGMYNKIYGAISTIIVLMLWLHLSSLVMLLGAQLNIIVAEIKQEKFKNH
ncbi:ribonuclease BN [Stanieria cyanosphaera PCC 7437]|uniref:Ribonuclease BN n=2 Tax=Stanieria cyanosphaera TaxID=102116 RepID=K9XP26_STAC7|nr:ribonuclease BN [Stanieria cyanosphaera PCC 7437]